MDGFLAKPVHADELLKTVRDLATASHAEGR
jgi:hypothetical protein